MAPETTSQHSSDDESEPASGRTTSDDSGGSGDSLDSLLHDLQSANSVDQLEQLLLHSNEPVDPDRWVGIVDSLLEAATVPSVSLAVKLLTSGNKVEWFDYRDSLQSLWQRLLNEPANFWDNPVKVQGPLCDQYAEVIKALIRITGDTEQGLCGRFWAALFKRPSLYYSKAVNSFDQLTYMGKATGSSKINFLNSLQKMLARSSEPVFHDLRCFQPLNQALTDALELALDEIEDGRRFSEASSRLVQTCVAVPLKKNNLVTPHGACLTHILGTFSSSLNGDYKKGFLHENLDAIIGWALDGTRDIPELEKYCQSILFEEVAVNYPKMLPPHVDALVAIVKRRDDTKLMRGISMLYPHATNQLLKHFDELFESLCKTKTFPKFHYEFLLQVSENHAEYFEGSHVSRLVVRMGQHDEEIASILKILCNVAKNNTPVMQGRGQDYYPIAVGFEEGYEENVNLTNRCLVWIALASESEATRVLKLMADAYRMPELKNASTPAKQSLLQSWIEIAKVHKKPFKNEKCQRLIEIYGEDAALKSDVKTLKKLINGSCSSVCTIM